MPGTLNRKQHAETLNRMSQSASDSEVNYQLFRHLCTSNNKIEPDINAKRSRGALKRCSITATNSSSIHSRNKDSETFDFSNKRKGDENVLAHKSKIAKDKVMPRFKYSWRILKPTKPSKKYSSPDLSAGPQQQKKSNEYIIMVNNKCNQPKILGTEKTYNEDFMATEVARTVNDLLCNSRLFNVKMDDQTPRFHPSELQLGSILGRGGFSVVSEIKDFNLKTTYGKSMRVSKTNDGNSWHREEQYTHGRNFIAKHCMRKGQSSYAFKTLNPIIVNDQDRCINGLIDLALEARFLSVLEHPHIIKIWATSLGDPFRIGYFIVLDRLNENLSKKMRAWKQMREKNNRLRTKLCGKTEQKSKELWIEKILVAYDLSSAMKYLHDHKIIFRDLKPDNIGFDLKGNVKIFDFGLAVELKDEKQLPNGTYKLEGNTGSLRYMAPEVALCIPYNLKVDVYSFGIMLWEMCFLETAFSGYTVNKHFECVVKRGIRPQVLSSLLPGLAGLMKNSWCEHLSTRPNFEEILNCLQQEIVKLRGCDKDFTSSGRSSLPG